ncbi:hypothetical protein LTR66_002160 [Elasticomyces elasticus]|nr:hypothetical protein LTR66_002160 [Elasticomyces elasticus]
MSNSAELSPEQATALFDILSHHETYAEIENFKYPGAIFLYGPPFELQGAEPSTSPILQTLLARFVLTLPGIRDAGDDFWRTRVQTIVEQLSAAELSESYDKGVLGIRKTLATAISALVEYPARGCLGGFPKQEQAMARKDYDKSKPDDVLEAWHNFLQQLVHGDLIDEMFKKAAETDDLSKHDGIVQAAHEYVAVNLASFLHYALILSPEGPPLLRVVENIHKLIPYGIIRQTLRVSNAATMIQGMVRIILAKVSVSAVTNWIGISSGADEGMNLLQQIISTVLGWDKKELGKRAEKIEKDKDGPSKEVREALKAWVAASREEHEECRNRSQDQSISIVSVILSLSSVPSELSEVQHAKALEYLSLHLSIRDRNELDRILCHGNPDHLTQAIRDGVSAYEPMIRQVHQAVDLSATVGDFERFMNDMIKLAKPATAKKGQDKPTPPSVEDFVSLLHKHQGASHRFIHQVAKNSKEVTEWFNEYSHKAAAQFRPANCDSEATAKHEDKFPTAAAGSMTSSLQSLYRKLSDSDREAVRKELDVQSSYLNSLSTSSSSRIRAVLGAESNTPYGPGAYLARWRDLLDRTPITPATPKGPVRTGASDSVKAEASRDVNGEDVSLVSAAQREQSVEQNTPEAPSVETTLRLLAPGFREVLVGVSK